MCYNLKISLWDLLYLIKKYFVTIKLPTTPKEFAILFFGALSVLVKVCMFFKFWQKIYIFNFKVYI